MEVIVIVVSKHVHGVIKIEIFPLTRILWHSLKINLSTFRSMFVCEKQHLIREVKN